MSAIVGILHSLSDALAGIIGAIISIVQAVLS
jgi:hypothetical protein